jgi:hypothetical protein
MHKKIIALLMMSGFLLAAAGLCLRASETKRKKFFIKTELNYLVPVDTNYRSVYGGGQWLPRVKAGYHIGGRIYFWAAYSSLPASGTIPGTGIPAESSQRFFSFGAGYYMRPAAKVSYKIDFGMLNVSFEEETLGRVYEDSTSGFEMSGGMMVNIKRLFFIETSVGYMYAEEFAYNKKIRMGGFRGGIGLGVRF